MPDWSSISQVHNGVLLVGSMLAMAVLVWVLIGWLGRSSFSGVLLALSVLTVTLWAVMALVFAPSPDPNVTLGSNAQSPLDEQGIALRTTAAALVLWGVVLETAEKIGTALKRRVPKEHKGTLESIGAFFLVGGLFGEVLFNPLIEIRSSVLGTRTAVAYFYLIWLWLPILRLLVCWGRRRLIPGSTSVTVPNISPAETLALRNPYVRRPDHNAALSERVRWAENVMREGEYARAFLNGVDAAMEHRPE